MLRGTIGKPTSNPEKSMSTYDDILENNRRWAARMRQENPGLFDELAVGQKPDILYIGCSDSRACPDSMLDVVPGTVFTHRNIANVVPHTDVNVQSVIEYAVAVLKVKHIVVCGHTACGGVAAAMQPQDLGVLNPWLRQIRDVYHAHAEELTSLDESARYDRLIALNVAAQCTNVLKAPSVQQRFLDGDPPSIHGWVYDVGTGLVQDLELDFSGDVDAIQKRFRLA